MWELNDKESWAPKNWYFQIVVLKKTSWTAKRSNQSILKEINPEYSLEGLMLKPKLQYFGHLMPKADSLEKPLMLGKIEDRRRGSRGWDCWIALLTQWTWVWANSGREWGTGNSGILQSMAWQTVGHNAWTTTLAINCDVFKDKNFFC